MFYGVKIALTGKMRSGKDTVAEQLINNYGFKRYAFGDGIRRVCHENFPEIVAQGKPRYLYQGVGQDFRKHDPDVWVKRLFNEMQLPSKPATNFVVTDLRQPNEYEALRQAGFFPVEWRIKAVEELTEAYFKQAKELPEGDQLTRLADYILKDDLTDKHTDKVTNTDFPIFSDGQMKLRLNRERASDLTNFSTDKKHKLNGRKSPGYFSSENK